MAMMISKFNKIIHNKTVWLVFAILISVAFVGVYTGQKASRSSKQENARKQIAGKLFGEEIARAEFGRAYHNVYLMYCMMSGRAINITDDVDDAIQAAAWKRLATLKKAAKMRLTATPEQTRNFIQRQPLFRNQQTGSFDINAYQAFVNNFLPRVGMGVKGFEQMMADNVVVEKALSMAAQGALVTDDEIKDAFHLYSDKLTVEYAAIPRRLVKTPEVGEAEAKAYYDSNPDEFRLPEKAIVRYVQFPVAGYTGQVAVTDEMISSYYENNKQRYLKPAGEDAPADTAPEYQPLDEVKESIREQYTTALAQQQAFNAADALVALLSDESVTFEQAAQQAGLEIVSNTPAFSITDSVRGVDPTAPFARAAFNLEKDAMHYYSDPVVGQDFIYVIALDKKLPSFLPAFDIVKDDAIEAARIVAAETAYIEKAHSVHTAIAADVKNGLAFSGAITRHRMKLETTEPFDISTQLEDEFGREIIAATVQLDEGALSELIPTSGEYLVASVKTREPGDEAVTLPTIRENLIRTIRDQKSAQLAAAWQTALLEEAGFEDLTDNNES